MGSKAMPAEQQEKLLAHLSGKSRDSAGRSRAAEFRYSRDAGPADLAKQLIDTFKNAGWTLSGEDPSQGGGGCEPRIRVRYRGQWGSGNWGSPPPAAQIVLEAFQAAGLHADPEAGFTSPNSDVCIVITGS
jgi:hypothetical protein